MRRLFTCPDPELDFSPTYPLDLVSFAMRITAGDDDEDREDDDEDDDDDEEEKERPSKKEGDDAESKLDALLKIDTDDLEGDELKEHNRKLRAAVAEAVRTGRKNGNKARRAESALEKLRQEGASKPKRKRADEDDEEDDRVEKARTEEREKANARIIDAKAEAALERAGLDLSGDEDDRERKLKRAKRLLDLDDVTVDEKGRVHGLDDAIADAKEDVPNLFARPRKKRSINGDDDREPKAKAKSATQIQAESLGGGRRR